VLTPWAALVAAIEPFYPKGRGAGRPPIGLERMLRMYLAQQCFGLSDEGIEDALYDSHFRLTEDTFSAHHRASWVSPLMDGQLIRGSIADRSPDQE
jgi:hypothetical protein